jgi:hypothetical protein
MTGSVQPLEVPNRTDLLPEDASQARESQPSGDIAETEDDLERARRLA